MKAVAIIPARIASTRLPRKILREINGHPMLWHVYNAARACSALDDVIVATDSYEIADVCRTNGWSVRMTSPEHRSGTDRVHEVAQSVVADVYVNVQGDEPLARREHLDVLLQLMANEDVQVGTLKTPCGAEDVNNPNAVKVVTAMDGRALYFSRATIPFDRDRTGEVRYFKHLGLLRLPQSRRSMRSACGPSRNWSAASVWSSCGFWTTAWPSTWQKRRSTQSA